MQVMIIISLLGNLLINCFIINMLASSPPLFSTIGFPFEEPISHGQNSLFEETEQFFPHQLFPISQPQLEAENSIPSQDTSSDLTMVKKLLHNASERDRRKKINTLYSSLRSLLPVADQMKNLSIPATISQVLKYIPELQKQVEGLTKKKEEILLGLTGQDDALINKESSSKKPRYNSNFVVSTNRLSDSEVAIQISCYTVHKIPLYEILMCLENDGFVILNVSSSETFGGRVFYNLHFQVDKTQRLELESLNEMLMSIIEKEGAI